MNSKSESTNCFETFLFSKSLNLKETNSGIDLNIMMLNIVKTVHAYIVFRTIGCPAWPPWPCTAAAARSLSTAAGGASAFGRKTCVSNAKHAERPTRSPKVPITDVKTTKSGNSPKNDGSMLPARAANAIAVHIPATVNLLFWIRIIRMWKSESRFSITFWWIFEKRHGIAMFDWTNRMYSVLGTLRRDDSLIHWERSFTVCSPRPQPALAVDRACLQRNRWWKIDFI